MLRVWKNTPFHSRGIFLFLSTVRFKSKTKSIESYEREEKDEDLSFLKPEKIDKIAEFIKNRLVVKINQQTIPIFSTEEEQTNLRKIFNWNFKKYVFHDQSSKCYLGFSFLIYFSFIPIIHIFEKAFKFWNTEHENLFTNSTDFYPKMLK